MFRKLSLFILLVCCASFVMTAAGQTPAPGTDKTAKVFSFAFGGDGGYLGVETTDISRDNFSKYGLRDVRGVAIEKVIDGSPAQTAGIQTGDVIVQLNGEEITSVRKLTRLIGEVAPDHQVKLTVLRGGDERVITATLGKRPAPKFENGAFSVGVPGALDQIEIPELPDGESIQIPRIEGFPGAQGDHFVWRSSSGRRIGIGITPLTKQLSEHFGVSGGVMVNNVAENSPAARAGIKAGDIIVEVDGKSLEGDADLLKSIREKKEGEISLTIVRNGSRQVIRVTPEEVKGSLNNLLEAPDGAVVAPGRRMKLVRPAVPAAPAVPMEFSPLFEHGRVL